MSDTKPIQVSKKIHRRMRELSIFAEDTYRAITERALTVELDKIERKKDAAMAKAVSLEE